MDVLSSRILLRPADPDRSRTFYRDVLGLAVSREFGPPDHRGTVFFCGNSLLEVSGHSEPTAESSASPISLWVQVRDVTTEYQRLVSAGVTSLRDPRTEPWGLIEAWIADPDGVRIGLIQVPEDHPLRRDQR